MAKPRKPKKPSKESVKAALARAEATSKGEPIIEPVKAMTPEIIPAEALKRAATAKKRARKRTKYSEPLAKAICKMLGRGMTLTSVCKRPLMPREDTVLDWAINPDHPFARLYARAREVGYIKMADDIIDISDDGTNDYMTRIDKEGGVHRVLNREVLERSRLRIDTRKWLLAKALPKIFGDKVAMEHSGTIEATASEPKPIPADHMSDITKRFATRAPAATVAPGPVKSADKPAKGAGLH